MYKFRRFIGLRIWLVPLALLSLSAQDRVPPRAQLPRDADKLVARAQEFWNYLLENQKAKALEFVAEDSRDAFLAGQSMSLISARVAGLDLSDNPNEAVVRTSVKNLVGATPAAWELSNRWIRKNNTWYLEVGDQRGGVAALFSGKPFSGPVGPPGDRALDADLKVPEVFDVGTILQGRPATIKFPIEYSGKLSFRVESLPRTFIYTVSEPLSLETHSFNFYVIPNSPHGEFTLPLKLNFYGEAIKLERNVTLKGKIFSPLSFRQVPDAPLKAGETLRVFVRNNMSQTVSIKYVASEFEGSGLKWPEVLRPNEEGEILYKPLSDTSPERLEVVLTEPAFDLTGFTHTFRKTP